MNHQKNWESTRCALCGESTGKTILMAPHSDCPSEAAPLIECARCGLKRLGMRPDQDCIGSYYGDTYNAFVGRFRGKLKQKLWNFLRDTASRPDSQRIPRWISLLLAPVAFWAFDINVRVNDPGLRRVIEVGCGYGDLLYYLKSRGCTVQGVDLDERAAEVGARMGVPIFCGPLESFKAAEGAFDQAILCHSLEHVPDPEAVLRQLCRLLRPGGRLHIAVPNGNATALKVQGTEWMHWSFPLHFWFFDAASLTALLEKTGFELVARPYSTSRHHQFMRFLNLLTKTPGKALKQQVRYIVCRLGDRNSGDVLRITAIKRCGDPKK